MKGRIFSLVLLVLFLSLNLVSATITLSPTSLTFNPKTTSQTFLTSTNETSTNISVPSSLILTGETSSIIFAVTPNGIQSINSSGTQFTISTSDTDFSDFFLGKTYPAVLTIRDDDLGTDTNLSVSFENSYCKSGNQGDLRLDVSLDNRGLGEDDEWYPLDTIEVEVNVENNADDTIDDIVVSWGVYNKRTGKFIIDDDEKKFNLKKDADKTLTFSFLVDPKKLDESDSEDDFAFFVKAYSKDEGESSQCDEFNEDITIFRDSHFVALGNIDIPEATCDSSVEINADIWNIGDDEEQDVYLIILNSELKINQRIDIGDIDILKKKSIQATINIPKDAKEKTYILELRIYDDNDELFENDDNDKSYYTEALIVKGNCAVVPTQTALISASLASDIAAGKQAIIKATIKNLQDKQATYTIAVSGNEGWASVSKIEPVSLTLNAGESKDALIYLDINADASGDKILSINTLTDGQLAQQQVSLNIPAKTSFLTGLSIFENLGENWFIWVIVAINVILIIAIIIVAVKLSRS